MQLRWHKITFMLFEIKRNLNNFISGNKVYAFIHLFAIYAPPQCNTVFFFYLTNAMQTNSFTTFDFINICLFDSFVINNCVFGFIQIFIDI